MNKNEKRIYELKKSPLFALSSSSKELSHSNYWAWLMEDDAAFIEVFFKKLNVKECKVFREKKHCDITIECEGKAYIVENKIKSIPTQEQLDKYKKDVDNFERGILTGIKDTIKCPEGWRFLSYEEIADEFEKINRKKNDAFLTQYISDIRNISKLLKSIMYNVKNAIPLDEDYKELKEIRFDDIAKKYKASDFHSKIVKEKEIKEWLKDNLVIMTGYNHKHSTIDIKFQSNNGRHDAIGIQIENNQYRRILEKLDVGEDDFNEYKKLNWFGEYQDHGKGRIQFSKDDIKKTSMTKKFCKYSANFIYQYWNLDDEGNIEGLSYQQIKQQIIDDIKIAKAIWEN